MNTYLVEYQLLKNWIPENKVVLVEAHDQKQAIKEAEEHAFNGYPNADWIKVKKVNKM